MQGMRSLASAPHTRPVRLMRRWIPLVLASLVAAPLSAQTAWVSGRVVDATSGEPLADAEVFLSGTALGDVADGAGRFVFRAPVPRSANIVAARPGYGTAVAARSLAPGDVVQIEFQLPAAPPASEPVRSSEAYEVFRETFVGSTANADVTHILNPGILTLAYGGDRLQAAATAPLTVRNDALGYELTIHDFTFAAEDGLRVWDGHTVFRDLCAPACGAGVDRARRIAYEGSLQHFLAAVAADRLNDEGFQAGPVYEPYDGGSGLSINAARGTGSGYSVPSLDREPFVAGWLVETGGALRISYKRERDPRLGYVAPQVSWLTAPDSVLRIGPDGGLLDPDGVVHYGYWDWVRIAELLPSDYRPAPPADG